MFNVGQGTSRNCQGVTRRELLQVGGLGLLGLTLADLLHGATSHRSGAAAARRLRASSSSWKAAPASSKPSIPSRTPRTTFAAPTAPSPPACPGTQICELLPMMAERMHRCALIRSLTGFTGSHTARPALTGSRRKPDHLRRGRHPAQRRHRRHAPLRPPGRQALQHARRRRRRLRPGVRSRRDPRSHRADRCNCRSSRCRPTSPPIASSNAASCWRPSIRRAPPRTASPAIERMDTFHQRAANILTSTRGPRGVRSVAGTGSAAQPIRRQHVRPIAPDGAPARRGRHALRPGQVVRLGRRLGHSRLQLDRHRAHGRGAVPALRSRPVGPARRFARARPARPRRWSWSWARWAARRGSTTGAAAITGARACSRCWRAAAFPAAPSSAAATPMPPIPRPFRSIRENWRRRMYRLLGIDTNTDPRVRPFIGTSAPVAALI